MARSVLCAAALCALVAVRPPQAQTLSAADRDSIELAVARVEKAKLPDGMHVMLEPHVRAGYDRWGEMRSADQIARLRAALGNVRLGKLGCIVDPNGGCDRLVDNEIGIAFQAPTLEKDQVTITVEQYASHGLGSATYLVSRSGKAWKVEKLLRGSAS